MIFPCRHATGQVCYASGKKVHKLDCEATRMKNEKNGKLARLSFTGLNSPANVEEMFLILDKEGRTSGIKVS